MYLGIQYLIPAPLLILRRLWTGNNDGRHRNESNGQRTRCTMVGGQILPKSSTVVGSRGGSTHSIYRDVGMHKSSAIDS